MMHKIAPSIDYNFWLKSLDTQLNEPTNNVPEVVKQMNKNTFLINSPMSRPSLTNFHRATMLIRSVCSLLVFDTKGLYQPIKILYKVSKVFKPKFGYQYKY